MVYHFIFVFPMRGSLQNTEISYEKLRVRGVIESVLHVCVKEICYYTVIVTWFVLLPVFFITN